MASKSVSSRPLRVATAADVPATPLTVDEAAATGDHRKLLVALRERIATTIADPGCPPRDLAALSRRLQEIAKELDQIEARERRESKESADLGGDQDWNAEAI